MNDTLKTLTRAWEAAKEQERKMQLWRRDIEDQIAALLDLPADLDGTITHGAFKVTGRIDRKVDADVLQQLALDAGLTDHLSALFRWKPEINKKAWDSADESITRPLAGAITSKPGRPSFALTDKKEG